MSSVSQLAVPEAVCDAASPRVDLEQLIQSHFAFIWRLLRRLGLPRSDADDAAQQVFLIAGAKLDKIRVGSERAFLYGCALHRASKWQRTRARERRSLSLETDAPLELAGAALPLDELLDQAKARSVLDALLAEMPVSLRSVFVLYEVEQLSTLEIADLLGLPRGTVASRLRRAREDFDRRVKRLESGARRSGGAG
jgi:RNA polymerase sigma-70 factor (ECF subfamily)